MQRFTQSLVNFLEREDGPTGVEYAVLLALIVVMCFTAISAMGTNANQALTRINVILGGGR